MTRIIDRPHDPRWGVVTNICGRCGGSGRLACFNDSTGQPDETWCGICGGTGQDQHKDIMGPDHAYGIPAQRSFAGEISSIQSSGRPSGGRRRQ